MHAVPDAGDPHAIVATIMDAVPPGSYLAISPAGAHLYDRAALDGIKDIAARKVRRQLAARGGPAAFTALLGGGKERFRPA